MKGSGEATGESVCVEQRQRVAGRGMWGVGAAEAAGAAVGVGKAGG
jgi:hypothetical protein